MTRKLFIRLKAILGAALLTAVIVIIKPRDIWLATKTADWRLVAIAAALMPVNIALQEAKWRNLVRLVKPDVRWIESIGSLLGGIAFGVVTPGRLGEYGRALFISGIAPLNLVGLTVIDKFYNLGCTIAFGLPALATLPWTLSVAGGYVLISGLTFIALVNLTLLYLALDPRPVRSLLHALQLAFPRGGRIAQLAGGLDRFSAPQARITLAWTLAHYLVFLVQYWLLISAFRPLGILASSRSAAAILLAKSALPITLGGLGIDQFASIHIFSAFGITGAAAVNASLLMFAINVLIPALAGIPFIGRLQIQQNQG